MFSSFDPLPTRVKALSCTYKVSSVKSDGSITDINACIDDYNEAKTVMNGYASTINDVAVIYSNGTIINARYAIVKFRLGLDNVWLRTISGTRYTTIHTDYGTDAAFIDYDPVANRAKVKISGFSGWTNFTENIERIVPISTLVGNQILSQVDGLRIRTTTDLNASDNIIGYLNKSESTSYYEKKEVDGVWWYRILYNSQTGWVANKDGLYLKEANGLNVNTYYSLENGNIKHSYTYLTSNVQSLVLGKAPSFMNSSNRYYSFDGNYFYTDITKMLDDYRLGDQVYSNALNSDTPFYAYYLYLSTHSKTGYTADDFNQIIASKGYTRNKEYTKTYVIQNPDGTYSFTNEDRTNMSLMFGMGQSFINASNTYGVNGLMMFGTALNESGKGTSLIAFYKNNLFGLGAADSCPVSCARSYASANDSIVDFAKFTGSNTSSYSNPTGLYYFGSHYGNKGSGMNVNYALDPYWGEKQAKNSFINDNNYGGQDYESNTIGVITRTDVPLYKEPSTSSSIIYTLKNKNFSVYHIPIIVFDKIAITENGTTTNWYKVYTDVALDETRTIASIDYNFSTSYGYIKESDLYVSNHQPVITANDITVVQDASVNLMNGVSAVDAEDGVLTSSISYSGEYNLSLPGVYPITYKAKDAGQFSVSKTIQLTVTPSLYPYIEASDKEIPQYVGFNPLTDVVANDYRDGNITDKITILSNEVNTNVKGTYPITYAVTNSLVNTTTKTITITVIPNASPVITAANKVLKINDDFDPKANVTAVDKEDGTITDKILIVSNNVNMTILGSYKVIYQVADSVNNISTKEITVTVEDRSYVTKSGQFYFEKLEWNSTSQKLDVAGYLAIMGMNNTNNEKIIYDMVFKNNTNGNEIVIGLDRWLDGHPNRNYTDGIYNYSDTWFSGSMDLSTLPASEYTMYVRARSGNNQVVNLFRNILGKEMTRKITAKTGRGYLFRSNNYSSNYPIELFISDVGLISATTPPHSSNMFNSYKTMNFNNNSLNIVGTSYNINGDYSALVSVNRTLVLENSVTQERYTYSIGSIIGNEIPLNMTDGKSKVRGWFDSTDKVNISNIPVGNYIVYIRTKAGLVDDYGELNDIFLKPTTSLKTMINNKTYSISLNTNRRFRIELNVQ